MGKVNYNKIGKINESNPSSLWSRAKGKGSSDDGNTSRITVDGDGNQRYTITVTEKGDFPHWEHDEESCNWWFEPLHKQLDDHFGMDTGPGWALTILSWPLIISLGCIALFVVFAVIMAYC